MKKCRPSSSLALGCRGCGAGEVDGDDGCGSDGRRCPGDEGGVGGGGESRTLCRAGLHPSFIWRSVTGAHQPLGWAPPIRARSRPP
uniref:Uncharacterized protein n=1 Tax=Oryza sativa subsp. japonica TaxID=39947 RepID=Q69LI6_ORYSJ|nr:hypothetical protein [Oryza sativa Japonica Group]BAD36444.1 hypothetical protein [Oryza sativa Japonica Group]